MVIKSTTCNLIHCPKLKVLYPWLLLPAVLVVVAIGAEEAVREILEAEDEVGLLRERPGACMKPRNGI